VASAQPLKPDPDRVEIDAMIARARAAMREVADYEQSRIDRLCQALGWATANEQTFGRLTRMSVEESGMGSADGVPARSRPVG